MKRLIVFGIASLFVAATISVFAAGGADYGRGPETDPAGLAAVSALTTNLNASNLVSGTVPNARLDSELQDLAVDNGASVTNLNADSLASGTVPNARLDSELQDLADDNGASVTNLNASSIASGTLDAARLPGTAVVTDTTNLLTEGFFDVVDTTQLVFIAGSVTNVIDASIVTP